MSAPFVTMICEHDRGVLPDRPTTPDDHPIPKTHGVPLTACVTCIGTRAKRQRRAPE
ncbi:hypothetical protein Ga0080559_TMP469 (plasmid) [Salipiger profundus]|uniref:Uncharacterized protein n=1 Tax=Salipiger profundus TaxID=1229727 RepID=A0A1U7DCW6_9RHOB|nr:hypothetical protein Ga0080559_TMP469 [Salipiger profundus]